MPHEYHLLPRALRWLRRIRHRCGYGVHSPLAFDFITGVIYNKDEYYPYATLRRPLQASLSRLDEYDPESGLTAADLRLLFRLTNYQSPATIALLGASPTISSYITAARTRACHTTQPALAELIYCDSPTLIPLHQLTLQPPPSRMLIVRGIHTTPAATNLWHQLQASPATTLTFDLHRFGIALTRPKINRQHYVVNYF